MSNIGLITKEQSTKLALAIARYAEAQSYMDYTNLHMPGETSAKATRSFQIAKRDLTEMLSGLTEKD